MTIANHQLLLASLPNEPGVYCFLGDKDKPLYVGKASALKQRVGSYFRKSGSGHNSPRIQLMLREAVQLETTITASEGEALLLENNLIKSLKPRYNILFRDDKSYPYLQITRHPYPRITLFRGSAKKQEADFFGPFPNSDAVRETIDILQRTFMLRTCTDSVFASRDRPCLLHSIKRCSAPCTNRITRNEYAAATGQARDLINSGTSGVVENLQSQMLAASDAQQFERAAVIRDQLGALAMIRSRYFADEQDEDKNADYIGIAYDGQRACVNVLMVRGGRRIGEKKWYPSNVADVDAAGIAEAFLWQHYSGDVADADDNRNSLNSNARIYINDEDKNLTAAFRGSHLQARLVCAPSGDAAARIKDAARNAELALSLHNTQATIRQQRLSRLCERLQLPAPPRRMECYDISHSMGEETIASKVVFENGAPNRKLYRLYKIKTAAAGDDTAAIGEVILRRFTRMKKEADNNEVVDANTMPDLVFIDGGRGQLSAAQAAFAEAAVAPPLLFAIAKGEKRQVGKETILAADGEVFQLPPTDEALHLIQAIRDEAHRFAISGHRRRRDKKRARTSALDGIDGLGEKKKNQIMQTFGGLAPLKAASIADLAKVNGIGPHLATRIYQKLH